MGVEEIVPGIEGISFGYVNAFAIRGDGLTLVDSGLPGSTERLRRGLAAFGGVSEVRAIAVTHHHYDHIGGLAALIEEAGASVWAHPADARVLRGEAPPPPQSRWIGERIAVRVVSRFGPKPRPANVEHEIADGDELPIGGGLIAYHTPGHTAGHMSFLSPAKRVLFVGDAAANILGRLGPPIGLMNEDHEAVKRSIAKVAALDFDVACFGHGRPLTGRACVAFRRFAEKIAG